MPRNAWGRKVGQCRRHPGYFCTVRIADNKVGTLLARYEQALAGLYDAGERRAIVRAIFQDRLGWDALELETRRDEALSESELLLVYEPLKSIGTGRPLQYALGTCWFHGLRLEVAPGVLIPRPETEELVEMIVRTGQRPGKIVDIGTGSGCIALALKQAFPDADVIGIDVSAKALGIAARNAHRLGLDVDWLERDVLAVGPMLPEGTDLVVSNPPYVPLSERDTLSPVVRDHEPHQALFVSDDDPLLFFRRIASEAHHALRPGGMLWFEGHHLTASGVGVLLTEMGFAAVDVIKDLSGTDRFIRAKR